MTIIDKPINRIEMFSNDIIGIIESYRPEVLDSISSDTYDALDHQCDFEDFNFFVVNGEQVITADGLNGDVIGSLPLDDFIKEAIEYAMEDI